jgi:hypothetical protein
MRKILTLATVTFLFSAIAPALADGTGSACVQAPTAASISADTMRSRIDDLGYDVRRLKMDDGCFKAQIVDRASVGAVTATFSTTGELVRAKSGF